MIAVKETFKQEAQALQETWHEEAFRDNEYLRARMVCLIADVGALIARHALEMGVDADQDCAFQVDRFADLLIWQTLEYCSQSQYDGEAREGNVSAYQLTERHARDFFDWPPSPDEEV